MKRVLVNLNRSKKCVYAERRIKIIDEKDIKCYKTAEENILKQYNVATLGDVIDGLFKTLINRCKQIADLKIKQNHLKQEKLHLILQPEHLLLKISEMHEKERHINLIYKKHDNPYLLRDKLHIIAELERLLKSKNEEFSKEYNTNTELERLIDAASSTIAKVLNNGKRKRTFSDKYNHYPKLTDRLTDIE